MTAEDMIRTMGNITIEYIAVFDIFNATWRDPVGTDAAFYGSGDTVLEAVAPVYAKYKEWMTHEPAR